jgi:predicted transcriptional regulator
MVRKINTGAPSKRLLTDAELEIMQVLWNYGQGTAAQVKDWHPLGCDLAFTTVSTMLRVLEQKAFVTASKQGRGHTYHPAISKTEYQSRSVESIVERVFEGAPSALVRQLLQTEKLSEQELDEIRALLK